MKSEITIVKGTGPLLVGKELRSCLNGVSAQDDLGGVRCGDATDFVGF